MSDLRIQGGEIQGGSIPEVPGLGGQDVAGGLDSFRGLLDALHALDEKQVTAESEAVRVAEGRPGNFHDAVLAMREAEISLALALSMRNKLVEAYHDIMRTQV